MALYTRNPDCIGRIGLDEGSSASGVYRYQSVRTTVLAPQKDLTVLVLQSAGDLALHKSDIAISTLVASSIG